MKTDKSILCGGVTDNSFNGPQTIESKNLKALDTSFSYMENDGSQGTGRLSFKLSLNGDKEFVISEDSSYGIRAKVGPEVVAAIQAIIDEQGLASLNGMVRYTAGLPEPYSPIHFNAEYESGESIYFQMDGNPEAAWCNEMAKCIAGIVEKYAGEA